ncbi:MAG: hypothetical protein JRJ60_20725 [Deltaproteobacteria bacterium]|nr:hypothetical protein [Deltaproteobacteria bacterium]
MVKNMIKITFVNTVIIFTVLFLSACGGEDSTAPEDDCFGEHLFGPEGGTIEVTDPDNVFYGLRIVIPKGALDECRAMSVDEGFIKDLPNGCWAWPHWSTHARLAAGGGEEPYDLELEFYFPVSGMNVEEGESPCAFGYDGRTEEWIIILPDSIDGSMMMVNTTYLDYWTWGKIDLDAVSSENLVGAMRKKYGDHTWDSVISGITEAISILETLYVDQSCATWTRVLDDDLPPLIQSRRDLLVSYQSQIGQCGTCDLFSLDFGLELSQYALAKTVILTADLWDLFFFFFSGFMPFVDKVEFGIAVQRYIALSFIENQAKFCDYSCVTEELGLSVYSTYAVHHVYLVTYYIVSLAIDNDYWVTCP